MGDVVNINVELWAEVFTSDGLIVEVSNHGRVRFFTRDWERGATISMEQMMCLGKALAEAYGKDDDGGKTDPAG